MPTSPGPMPHTPLPQTKSEVLICGSDGGVVVVVVVVGCAPADDTAPGVATKRTDNARALESPPPTVTKRLRVIFMCLNPPQRFDLGVERHCPPLIRSRTAFGLPGDARSSSMDLRTSS